MKPVSTPAAPAAVGPYSQGIDAGVFVSGQIGIDPAVGRIVETTAAGQAEEIGRNISAVLAAAGLTTAAVVKTTVFLADIADFPVVNEVYARHFPHKPARSCVAVSALPAGALVEIEAVAART